MSEKLVITKVTHHGGSVYLGEHNSNPIYSKNGDEILQWCADGWRTRFNQKRSNRQKYEWVNGKKTKNLIPIGDTVINISDSQAREDYSFLTCLPSQIIESTKNKEDEEWFSGIKRRKTNQENGRKPGRLPGFKSRKKDNYFYIWHNGGRNANYHKKNDKIGVITIKGKTPRKLQKPGEKCAWSIEIEVKHNGRSIADDYTSIYVNTTQRTVSFTRDPDSLNSKPVKHSVGLDRGGVVTATTSDGKFLHPDQEKILKWEERKKYHQAQMCKMRSRAEKTPFSKKDAIKNSQESKDIGEKVKKNLNAKWDMMRGCKYQHHKEEAKKYANKIKNFRDGWLHEVTTELIRTYGIIILEDLKIINMTKKGKNKRKRGLNRSVMNASLATFASYLEYKALRNGNIIIYVPPAYTSQRCHKCAYTDKENRESQAIFSCKQCGYTDNADYNAACNIWELGLLLYGQLQTEGTDLSAHKETCENGSGEIVRTTPSLEGFAFYKHKSDLDDIINLPVLTGTPTS